jgi:DNA adenine methylase
VFSNRLSRVQIESQDALRVIKSRDSVDTFFYCDPPYPETDQGHYTGYTQHHFNALLETLSNVKGRFLLSSFPNAELNKYAQRFGWIQTEHSKNLCATKINKGKKKVEVLTRNY